MIRLILTALLLLMSLLHSEETEYRLGEGIQVGSLPLYFGGYFSVEYLHTLHAEREVTLDDVALMLYGDHGNWSYMAEMEADDVYSETFGGEENETVQDHFHIERLYVDYAFNDHYALRAGKYNSPIGFWNLMPINVLRETTSNPISTEILFPHFTSGLGLAYHSQNSSQVSINLMAQHTEDLDALMNDEVYNNFDLDRHYGAGILLENGLWTYQLNGGYFHTLKGKSLYYLLGSLQYDTPNFQLLGEAGSQFDDEDIIVPYAGYLQGVYHVTPHHAAILRLEAYKEKRLSVKDSFAVAGYTYRPLYPIAFKGEYQWHSLSQEDKFLLSFSMLF